MNIICTYSSLLAISAIAKGKTPIAIYLKRVYCKSKEVAVKLLSDPSGVFSEGDPVEGFTGVLVMYSGESTSVFTAVTEALARS